MSLVTLGNGANFAAPLSSLLDPYGHVGHFTPLCLPPQVTLSYGMFENKRNSIHMKGAFSVEEDPSR